MTTTHMLLVGRSRDVHKKIKALGYKTSLMLESSKLTQEKLAPVYDRVIGVLDQAPVQEWVDLAVSINKIDPIAAIGAFTELHEKTAVYVSKALGLPYHTSETIEQTHEKNLLRNHLKAFELDDTPFLRLTKETSKEDYLKSVEMLGFPLILKPANARASLAVRAVETMEQAINAFDEFKKTAKKYDLLIERKLEGREFSVEGFSENGRHKIVCVTEKFKNPTTNIETGHLVPARISLNEYQQIVDYVKKVLDAISISFGPTHTEIFLTSTGPRIVESHVRLGGDRIATLIESVSEVDLEELWIRQSAGESIFEKIPEIYTSNARSASVQYLILDNPGRIVNVTVPEKNIYENIIDIQALKKEGDFIDGLALDSFSRAAECIAVSEDPEDAIECAKLAVSQIKFEVISD